MDELKLQLEKELIAQREQSVLDYNTRIESVVDIENSSNMFDLIVSTYRDEVVKQDALIDLMGLSLTNDFFREAIITREKDYLSFSNSEYNVHFCTTGDKTITVEYEAGSNPVKVLNENPILSETEEIYKKELLEKLQVYIKEMSFRSFKKVSRHYNNSKSMKKYFRTLKDCNPELEKRLIRELKENKSNKEINRFSLDMYQLKEEKVISFLNELTDLEVYSNNFCKFVLRNESGSRTLELEEINFK